MFGKHKHISFLGDCSQAFRAALLNWTDVAPDAIDSLLPLKEPSITRQDGYFVSMLFKTMQHN